MQKLDIKYLYLYDSESADYSSGHDHWGDDGGDNGGGDDGKDDGDGDDGEDDGEDEGGYRWGPGSGQSESDYGSMGERRTSKRVSTRGYRQRAHDLRCNGL